MIDHQLLQSAREIRKEYLSIMGDLSDYEKEIKKLSNFLLEKAEIFKNMNEKDLNQKGSKDQLLVITQKIVNEIQEIENEEEKISKRIESLNEGLVKLQQEEEVLYQTIKKRYPNLSDEKIKSEVSDTIKDLV
jgi:flagellar capping protein FliD